MRWSECLRLVTVYILGHTLEWKGHTNFQINS